MRFLKIAAAAAVIACGVSSATLADDYSLDEYNDDRTTTESLIEKLKRGLGNTGRGFESCMKSCESRLETCQSEQTQNCYDPYANCTKGCGDRL
jgi:hypothetical protein